MWVDEEVVDCLEQLLSSEQRAASEGWNQFRRAAFAGIYRWGAECGGWDRRFRFATRWRRLPVRSATRGLTVDVLYVDFDFDVDVDLEFDEHSLCTP